ncbi:MAG: helix-turn-helix transcriptional regulator, partial [Mycobacterium sp.]
MTGAAKSKTAAGRKPTYHAATRLARLVHELWKRPVGWSFDAAAAELNISPRTLMRYLAACREQLVDGEGRPLVETFRKGERRYLKLAESAQMGDSTVYQVISFYFALSVFQFLDGTVLKDGVADLWERFSKTLRGAQAQRVADFARKFYVVPHAMKDYRASDEHLDTIVRCLADNRRLGIDYGGLLGAGKTHVFDPYTLLMYRGGLYLVGRSHRGRKVLTLAVERMRTVERLKDSFDYPAGYSPERHTEGIFGIIEGPETAVEIQIMNPTTRAYLQSRRIHPTQEIRTRRDGSTVLAMTVRGTEELKYWILGFGPHLRVLKPAALRAEVASMLSEAGQAYRA